MRIVKHAIGAFCLLAALLLAVLWVRSYWVREQLGRTWYTDDGVYLALRREYWRVSEGQLWWGRYRDAINYRQYVEDREITELARQEMMADVRSLTRGQQAEESLSYRQLAPPNPGAERAWHGFERIIGGDWTDRNPDDSSPMANWWRVYAIPIWLPLLMFAAPAGLWLLSVLRRRRGAHGCPSCGYDLRATPDRCPECGRTC